jgi:hypothetical protein
MEVVWGLVVVVLALLAWGGQAVALFAPATAVKLTLSEAEDAVEPMYWADIRAEAMWDFFMLWTLVVAGVLLVLDHSAWPYFGLVGGGMYVYFAGRGVLSRVAMQRDGHRIGSPQNVKAAFVLLPIWGVAGLVTIIAAVGALS